MPRRARFDRARRACDVLGDKFAFAEGHLAQIVFDKVSKRYPDGLHAVRALDLDDRGRRIPRARRPVRLRQVDGASHGRRPRGHQRWAHHGRRRRRQRSFAARAQHRDGVPELCALSASDRRREHRLWPESARRRKAARSTPRSRRPPISSNCRTISIASPLSSPAASASASPWAGRSCASRTPS